MTTETNTSESTIPVEEQVIHDRTNSWFDGDKWIPVSEMSNSHLRKAKLFAQKKEEYFWHKSTEFGEKVEMLENEAECRGIILKDYRSKFQKNSRKLKEATKAL